MRKVRQQLEIECRVCGATFTAARRTRMYEDVTNYDPSNLMVFPSQAAHAAHHAKLKKKEVTQ
jgi:hypothetical protein